MLVSPKAGALLATWRAFPPGLHQNWTHHPAGRPARTDPGCTDASAGPCTTQHLYLKTNVIMQGETLFRVNLIKFLLINLIKY